MQPQPKPPPQFPRVRQDRPDGTGRPPRATAREVPEPVTARALWPTFMRRTLTEEELAPRRAGG